MPAEGKPMSSKITVDDANAFFQQVFPATGPRSLVTDIDRDYARMRWEMDESRKRPGNYISGPTQMSMADTLAYVAIFTRIGIVPMAVTSNLNINFMRPCIGDTLIGEGRVLKLGKTLAVIEVEMRAESQDKLASHAMVTYSIPQEES